MIVDSEARKEKQKKAKEKKKKKKKQKKIRKRGKARLVICWLLYQSSQKMESSTEQRQGDEITGDLSRHAPSVVMLLGSFRSQSAKCEL